MFRCHVCGSNEAGTEYIKEVFEIDAQMFMVEDIPAVVCARCGEETLSRETTERIRRLVHSAAQPARSIALKVFEFA